MRPYRIIISGGGTGGHIYPAIAIAKEIERRYPDTQFLFVGAKDRMEMHKVPQAGYEIKGLWISGIQRKVSLENLKFPFKLISSLWKSQKIIKKFKPDVVIGTGGFASGALLKMATHNKIPALIQEQNSYAGITNKLLSKNVQKICVAYDEMHRFFPKDRLVKTGNPVRSDLLDIDTKRAVAFAKYNLSKTSKVILIMGGSLGARAINELVSNHLDFFTKQGVQLLWQTGKMYYEQYKHHQSNLVQVMAYIDQMDMAYAASDIIVSRAGASSVSELCIVGKATVFIPSPNVAEDHQTKNAAAVTSQQAGVLIKEANALKEFESILTSLLMDEEKCLALGENIKKLALPEATKHIVNEVEKLILSYS